MQNVRELVVHGVEEAFVEHLNVGSVVLRALAPLLHLVDVIQRNLHSSRCCSQHFGALCCAVTARTDELEDARAILFHEVFACILGVDIVVKVHYQVCQQLRALVVGRREHKPFVGCRLVEAVIHLHVIRHYKVVVEPLVELGSRLCLVDSRHRGVEDAVGEFVFAAARCQNCHQQWHGC